MYQNYNNNMNMYCVSFSNNNNACLMRLFVAACGWLDANKLKKIREAYFYDTGLGVNFCAKKAATHVLCDTLDGSVAMGNNLPGTYG